MVDALNVLTRRARAGDRKALKELMFPYNYGTVRDWGTGEIRSFTSDEREAAYRRIMGEDPDVSP